MIAYLFFIVFFAICFDYLTQVLREIGNKKFQTDPYFKNTPKWKVPLFRHLKRGTFNPFVWGLYIAFVLFIPIVYEFPGIMIFKKGYILNNPCDTSKPYSIEEMNWYGNFNGLNGSAQTCLYVDKSSPGVYHERTFRVS